MSDNEFILKGLSQLGKAAGWVIKKAEGYKVIGFYGGMGAGKTTLIKEICRQSGVKQEVTSPTFALVNEYNIPGDRLIFHFDFYRLEYPEEALDIGFEDYIFSGNLCLMEWPDRIKPYLPAGTLKVFIDVRPDNSRIITIEIPA